MKGANSNMKKQVHTTSRYNLRNNASRQQKDNQGKFICTICYERKLNDENFNIQGGCNHSFCKECIKNHISSKLQENVAKVKCPSQDCSVDIDPQMCKDVIPKQLFERWERVIDEHDVIALRKLYCPYIDCSAVMPVDENVVMRECPACRRMLCGKCKVPWHKDLRCDAYQRVAVEFKTSEDVMLLNLIKENGWSRCSRCGHVVELDYGCVHITCRCGNEYCYKCGTKWQHDHLCPLGRSAEELFYANLQRQPAQ